MTRIENISAYAKENVNRKLITYCLIEIAEIAKAMPDYKETLGILGNRKKGSGKKLSEAETVFVDSQKIADTWLIMEGHRSRNNSDFMLKMPEFTSHDIRGYNNAMYSYLERVFCQKKSSKGVERAAQMIYFLRSFSLGAAYLGLEDNELLEESLVSPVCELFSRDYDLKDQSIMNKNIATVDVLAMYQLLKNTGVEIPCKLVSDIHEDHYLISVHDKGKGIRDLDKKALPLKRYPELFKSFSTKGRGLGLQAVKRAVDMRRGFIEIQSSVDDKVITYSSRGRVKDVSHEAAKLDSPGTAFTLYMPKLYS
ncbi:ATP-binding protein [Thermoproteota archaeon]